MHTDVPAAARAPYVQGVRCLLSSPCRRAGAPKHENTKHSPQASKAKTQKHKTHALRVRLKHKNTKRQNTARRQQPLHMEAILTILGLLLQRLVEGREQRTDLL